MPIVFPLQQAHSPIRVLSLGAGLLLMSLLTVSLQAEAVGPATDMVRIPAGEFLMGSPAGTEGFSDEQPQRLVFLGAFWMDRYEVTNEAYAQFVRETDHPAPANPNPAITVWENGVPLPGIGDHPVVNVGWEDAMDFCRWAGKRLPTEAEWEKAARGTDARLYPWGNTWDPMAANSASFWAGGTVEFKSGEEWRAFWMEGDGAKIVREKGIKGEILTRPVGSFPKDLSPHGLYDMAGNAAEWVADWYAPHYYENSPLTNPPGPDRGFERAMRGGSWLKPEISLRTSYRDFGFPQSRPSGTGFRCAKDAR